jgi:hypothetical protein
MRAREYLIEYNRQITQQNYGDKIVMIARRDPTIPAEVRKQADNLQLVDIVLSQLEKADPTRNKEYTQGLAKLYANGGLKMEDATSTLADYLTKFHKLKAKRMIPPPYNDFLKYNKVTDVMDVVDQLPDPDAKEETNRGQAKEIYNDADVRVIQPEDQTAACYYGQGTRWCTAAKNNNQFDYYAEDGPLYIVIPKKPTHPGEKYQIHFDSRQFMDENDRDANMDELVDRYPQLGTLFHEEAEEHDEGSTFAPPEIREKLKAEQVVKGKELIKEIGVDQGNGIVTVNLNNNSQYSNDETNPWTADFVGKAATGRKIVGTPAEYSQEDGDWRLHSYAVIDTRTNELAIVYAAKNWHGDNEDDIEGHIGPDFKNSRGVKNPRIMAVAEPLLQDLVKVGVLTHQARAADTGSEETDANNNAELKQAYQQLITKYGAPGDN